MTLERRDEIVELASGHEETNQRWRDSRRSWSAGLDTRRDLATVISLFEEAGGRANSFHFRDWLDWRSVEEPAAISPTDQPLGIGDGATTAFQLVKRYGAAMPYDRPISLPHAASLRVAIDGAEVLTGWSLAPVGGVVTFTTPPTAGAVVTAGFTFDVPVRFRESMLSVRWAFFLDGSAGLAAAPEVSVIEVRLDP